MKSSLWKSSLEQFGDELASVNPVPASVCASAVTATFALNLLCKVLGIPAQRKGFTGDVRKMEDLLESAKTTSACVRELADEDIAAFNSYLESVRLPKSNEQERDQRKRAIALSLDKVIQVPLNAARLAVSGMDLCVDAAGFVPTPLIAEVAAAASLLAGAVRGLIVSAEFNVRQLAGEPDIYNDAMTQLEDLRRKALRQEDSVRQQVASMIAVKNR